MKMRRDLADEIYQSMTEPAEAIFDGHTQIPAELVQLVREAARDANLPAVVSETADGVRGLLRFLRLADERGPITFVKPEGWVVTSESVVKNPRSRE
jgi:hypothetical protein